MRGRSERAATAQARRRPTSRRASAALVATAAALLLPLRSTAGQESVAPPAPIAPLPAPNESPASPRQPLPPPSLPPAPAVPVPAALPSAPVPTAFDYSRPLWVHRTKRAYVTSGTITFGVTWGFAGMMTLLALTSEGGHGNPLTILLPVAGPFFFANMVDHPSARTWTLVSLWSAAEAVGGTLLVLGIKGEYVPAHYRPEGGLTIGLAPEISPHGTGLSLRARF